MRSSHPQSALLALLALLATVLAGCPDPANPNHDFDGDTFTENEDDCDDEDAGIFPGSIEVFCDGIDQNCDGVDRDDADGDGVAGCPDSDPFDCDDEDENNSPNLPEICDGSDNDCDGAPDNGLPEFAWWLDEDGDGFGAGTVTTTCEDSPPTADHVSADLPADEDCDDGEPGVYPGATEICDGVDQDCDGELDPPGANEYWPDADGDGAGDEDGAIMSCLAVPPADHVAAGGAPDCDDTDADKFPGNPEVCDGVDQDCDGVLDPPGVNAYWPDADGDGAGDEDGAIMSCLAVPPADHVAAGGATDCDDADPDNYPGNAEVCDAADNDCDLVVDNGFDVDGDLVTLCGPDGSLTTLADNDCDDGDILNFPGNAEVCDSQDNDCDTVVDEGFDADNDGYSVCDSPADCNDANPSMNPGATEICDGLDNVCSGTLPDAEDDGDGDLYIDCIVPTGIVLPGVLLGGDDCDDLIAAINPGATEVCNGADDDCDGVIPPTEVDVDGDLYLLCGQFSDLGIGYLGGDDCDDTVGTGVTVYPGAPEVCDGDLETCGGVIDDGFDTDGDSFYDGADAGCVTFYGLVDCDDSNDAVYPGAVELCDTVDNDCDTLVDAADPGFAGSDYDADGDAAIACGGGDCDDNDATLDSADLEADGESTCDGDCDDSSPKFNTSHFEFCDGEDNDCNGLVDDGLVADADGDGFTAAGCGFAGDDCDDGDPHTFPDETYTSGWQRQCAPAVEPGFFGHWAHARLNLPSFFEDPQTGAQFLYFRGHHNALDAQIGYATRPAASADWGTIQGPILNVNLAAGSWDGRRISHPSVVYVPGKVQGYVMAYHAQHATASDRALGIATANLPTGQDTNADGVADAPFQRTDLAGVAVAGPVVEVSAGGTASDNEQVVNPSLWYDGTSQILHMWYTGRFGNPNDYVIVHASCDTLTTDCGPGDWTKTDADSDGSPDIFLEGTVAAWDDLNVQQTFVMEHTDPGGFFGYELEVWYTGASSAVGYAQGDIVDASSWESYQGGPVLTATTAADRYDSQSATGRGVYWDDAAGEYNMYYGTSVALPVVAGGTEGTDPLWGVGNFSGGASYIGHAINFAPVITPSMTCASAAGAISDNGPDTIELEVFDGSTMIAGPVFADSTGNSSIGVQSTTFAIPMTLAAGAHDITVVATDAGGVQRSATSSLTCP